MLNAVLIDKIKTSHNKRAINTEMFNIKDIIQKEKNVKAERTHSNLIKNRSISRNYTEKMMSLNNGNQKKLISNGKIGVPLSKRLFV